METKRTTLRRFKKSDLEFMRQLEGDPDVVKCTPYKIPQTIDQTKARLDGLVEKEGVYAPFGVWAAFEKNSKEFLGWFMLMRIEASSPELGFMLVKKFWGQGYATEIAARIIELGFQELQQTTIVAHTNTENISSMRVLEKLGFQYWKNILGKGSSDELKVFKLEKKL